MSTTTITAADANAANSNALASLEGTLLGALRVNGHITEAELFAAIENAKTAFRNATTAPADPAVVGALAARING